jgi:hypothetical protein
MVLLGMNRVVVKDGTIAARLRFRAAAADHATVDYAVSDDPAGGGSEWGRRGSRTLVSTVGVNVQTDSELKAELFGDVKINFASETVPLDRFVDDARRTLLERHARQSSVVPSRSPETSRSAITLPTPGAAAPATPAPGTPAPAAPLPATAPVTGGTR